MAKKTGVGRAFGRKYIIRWDDEVRRYHVSLGAESIGFHKSHDGAVAIAQAHSQRVALPNPFRRPAYDIQTIDDSGVAKTGATVNAR